MPLPNPVQLKRAYTVRVQFKEDIDGTESAKDISDSAWVARFRAWSLPPSDNGTFLVNITLTKQVGTSSAGDTGIAQKVAEFLETTEDARWEYVLVDTNTNASTPTGKREYVPDGYPKRITVVDSVDA